MQDMEETRYRMHPYQYKQKIWQCEIPPGPYWFHTNLDNCSFLASSVRSYSLLSSGTFPGYHRDRSALNNQIGCCFTDALAAVQQITQPLPPTSCTTPVSISPMDSDEASDDGAQGRSFRTPTKQKQVGNVKPVPRSEVNNTQEFPTQFILHSLHEHIIQIGVMVHLHTSYHLLYLIAISPICHKFV